MALIKCWDCNGSHSDSAKNCPHCGALKKWSDRSRFTAMIFCIFLGIFGVHRFYVGKIGTGLLWVFTAGFCGIGVLVDLIRIIFGEFTDFNGNQITKWQV